MQLSRDGRRLNYEVSGQGEEFIILIPALGASMDMWREQLAPLESAYTVVRYNPAGHDAAAVYPDQPLLADYAHDLLALTEAIRADCPHVVGLSMGGMIAQEYAIRNPTRIGTLTLACTASSYPEEQRRQMRQRAGDAEMNGMASIAAGRIEQWLTARFRERRPDIAEWVRTMVASADPRAYAQAARAAAGLDTTGRLNGISCPVLVLSASEDPATPPGSPEQLISRIAGAQQHTIEGASHLCNVEKALEFNSVLISFVRSPR